MQIDHITVDASQIRDLRSLALGPDGRIQVLPASFWESTTAHERGLFGARTGIYSFPTVELVERLRELVAGRSAIEIGSGHGVLAETLGIPGTDSFQQLMPQYRRIYEAGNLAITPYGPKVVEMHASRAVRHYKPDVVIGCWCTHKYDPKQHERGGNEVGIDEFDILRNCSTYVLVGNEKVHALTPLWAREHSIEYPSYVKSRATNGSRDFIATFRGLK